MFWVKWVSVGAGVVLAAVLAVVAALPGITASWSLPAEAVYEPTTIKEYRADFTIDDAGALHAVERLTLDFPVTRRGIFRFFDIDDPNAPELRRRPQDVTVTRDGVAEHSEWFREKWGRIVNLRVGREDVHLPPGQYVYEIRYRVDDVLLPEGDGSRFYWNLIPGGWLQQIQKSRLTVNLPEQGHDVWCAVGAGATDGCGKVRSKGNQLVVTTDQLDPNTPVTIRADLDRPVPERQQAEVPWGAEWDLVLGDDVGTLATVLLLALLAAGLGVAGVVATREREPGFPLMYSPPEGVGPAQAAYVLTEKPTTDHYIASLMLGADHGLVSLRRDGKHWTIARGRGGAAGLDPVTTHIAGIADRAPYPLTVGPKRVAEGQILQQEMAAAEKVTRQWGLDSGMLASVRLGYLGAAGVVLSFVASVTIVVLVLATSGESLPPLLAWLEPLRFTAVAAVPTAFWVTGGRLLGSQTRTRRTQEGRDMWSKVGGFRRMLATPSSKDRFDFSGREELYTEYIPWAVAFGCADEWADKYRAEVGSEPPMPAYLGGYHAHQSGRLSESVSSVSAGFNASVAAAVSAYQATQSSSSSGGGSSGGGGGGGGGGGSW